MRFIINTEAPATRSIIKSLEDNQQAETPTITLGDKLQINLLFSNGEGQLASFTGQPGLGIIIAIGTTIDRNAMTTTATLHENQNEYQAILDLSTAALNNYVTGATAEIWLEIQVSYANGMTETLCQQKMNITNEIIK